LEMKSSTTLEEVFIELTGAEQSSAPQPVAAAEQAGEQQ